jgi:hypothetical protein
MFANLDESLQCVFRTRICVEKYLPIDVTAYDAAFPQLGGNFCWEVFFALVKEPLPVKHLLQQIKIDQLRRGQGQAEYVHYGMIFVKVCRAMHDVPTPAVWTNLNGPGKVACFMGFLYI